MQEFKPTDLVLLGPCPGETPDNSISHIIALVVMQLDQVLKLNTIEGVSYGTRTPGRVDIRFKPHAEYDQVMDIYEAIVLLAGNYNIPLISREREPGDDTNPGADGVEKDPKLGPPPSPTVLRVLEKPPATEGSLANAISEAGERSAADWWKREGDKATGRSA